MRRCWQEWWLVWNQAEENMSLEKNLCNSLQKVISSCQRGWRGTSHLSVCNGATYLSSRSQHMVSSMTAKRGGSSYSKMWALQRWRLDHRVTVMDKLVEWSTGLSWYESTHLSLQGGTPDTERVLRLGAQDLKGERCWIAFGFFECVPQVWDHMS